MAHVDAAAAVAAAAAAVGVQPDGSEEVDGDREVAGEEPGLAVVCAAASRACKKLQEEAEAVVLHWEAEPVGHTAAS